MNARGDTPRPAAGGGPASSSFVGQTIRKWGLFRDGRLWSGGPRVPVATVFAITALGLLGNLMLVWSTIRSERAERMQATRTAEVMSALRDIDRAALNAETGQRGYFITLDRRYLAAYEFGRALYPRALGRLHRLVDDDMNDRQRTMLNEVEQRANAKFAELQGTVALTESGMIRDAQQKILSNEGQVAMERLRDALADLERYEQRLLARATADAAASENRVLPLLAFTMILMIGALLLGLWQTLRAARADAVAAHAEEIEAERDRADLLAHELNHRVKNLFAVVLAIVRMSARQDPAAKPVIERIAARVHALLEAHDVTQGKQAEIEGRADIGQLVDKVLAPYVSDENPMEISGPEIALTAREATPVGLVLHELATNAVKYGAWSQDGGTIAIAWKVNGTGVDRRLFLQWEERCPASPTPTDRKGFGSMLMESSARQLNGRIERRFEADGMIFELEIPHPE